MSRNDEDSGGVLARTTSARTSTGTRSAVTGPEDGSTPTTLTPMVERLTLWLAAFALLSRAGDLYSLAVAAPLVAVMAAAVTAVLLVVLVGVAMVTRPTLLDGASRVVLAMGGVVLVLEVILALHFERPYATDEEVFLQAAATALLHGHQPYGMSLVSAFSTYRLPLERATFLLNGGMVKQLSYPALSLLLVAVSAVLTHGYQSVVVADSVAVLASLMLLFAMLARPVRSLAVLVTVGMSTLFGEALGGLISVLTLPFLLVTAWQWPDTGRDGHFGRSDWLRAIALGLACSIQQVPWLIAPFLLAAIWRERSYDVGFGRGARMAAQFALIAGGVFVVINSPFLVADPSAWATSVAAPLLQNALPYGQGLISLTTFGHLGGGDLTAYSAATALLYVSLLAAAWRWHSRLRRAIFVLPVLPLFVSSRPLDEYWLTLLPVWLLGLMIRPIEATPGAAGPRSGERGVRTAGWAALLAGAGAALAVSLALASPPPLQMRITAVRRSSVQHLIDQVSVTVRNDTTNRLRPHFAVDFGLGPTSFWVVTEGPTLISGHNSAKYVLRAPTPSAQVPPTPFAVDAVTDTPATFSSTGVMAPGQP